MQFKIPQDVLRADKIVAFLTLRQLVIVVLGGSISYILYLVLAKQYFIEIWLPPVAFVTLVTMAFAFITFHDLPFEKAIILFLEYWLKPRKLIWQKIHGDYVRSVLSNIQTKKVNSNPVPSNKTKSLQDIVNIVDTPNKTIRS